MKVRANRSAAIATKGPMATCDGSQQQPMNMPISGGQWEAVSRRRFGGGCPQSGAGSRVRARVRGERVSLEPPGGPLEGSGRREARREARGEAARGGGWTETPAAS